ncbi:unnamed protein product [Coregonus sp. 'balchen']|nr:unnamed protein product [Coregonus sp. 'balchen']
MDFIEREAEESEEEFGSPENTEKKALKHARANDDEEEEEENTEDQDEDGNLRGLIDDGGDEGEGEEEEEDEEEGKKDKEGDSDSGEEIGHRKRKRSFDDRLDDDDIDLIEENLGVKVKRQKFRRLRDMSDDEDEEGDEDVREAHEKDMIADEIFMGTGADEGEALDVPLHPGEDEEEDDEESDIDDFIVDDDGQPLKKPKWRKKLPGYTDAALQEAQEIFGGDFDFAEFDTEAYEDAEEEEEDADEESWDRPKKQAKKRVGRRSIFEIYEPSELESTEDDELEQEAEWIYRNAFSTLTISMQENADYLDRGPTTSFSRKGPSTIQKIKEALNFMRNQHFEVPFIAFYRKEYVEPELNINDLWKVWQWDEKWTQLKTRKQNLRRLFQKMQGYQFEQISADPDKPLADGIRPLDTSDLERLKDVQSSDELGDVYNHFLLYYGRDIPKMQNAARSSKKKLKKIKEVDEDGNEQEVEEEEEEEEEQSKGPDLKLASRRDMYSICQCAGLDGLAKKFGLTPEQFGENLRDSYQRHETEQFPAEPMELAKDYICSQTCAPTDDVDEAHYGYSFKYLKNKPVKELNGDQFLKMFQAEEEGLLTINICIDLIGVKGYGGDHAYYEEIKQFYYRDEFSHQVQEWNRQRTLAIERSLKQFLYPQMAKELKNKLIAEAKENIIKACSRKLYNWLKVAPYRPDQQVEEEDEELMSEAQGKGIRVLGIHDIETLKKFLNSKKPHIIAIAGENRDAQMVIEDIKRTASELEQESSFPTIGVELVDNELAMLYMNSKKSEVKSCPHFPKHAVSVARKIQDPLVEYAQEHVVKEDLLNALYCEFINRVNEVGVDVNRAMAHPYTQSLVQYVCGLGPRKGSHLLRILKQNNTRLENRTQLVTMCHMGPKVFINCAGFIKIDTASLGDSTDSYIEVLDGSRVHPETYEWARKMAGYGNKGITLYDIRAELSCRYKDLRSTYRGPNTEEIFNLLTKETPETFYIGKLITSVVTGIAHRRPQGESYDQAIRNDETGLWQCPFCQQDNFPELSEVWNHFDSGSCPGQAIGVRCRMDNGVTGFIPTKFLSDKVVKHPEERVKVGMTVHCRIMKIDIEKLSVDLTCRTSDLSDKNNEWKLPKDTYYDFDTETEDVKQEEEAKKKQQRTSAEKMMESMDQGDVIIRPSSKGENHLTVTWKVADGIYQHIDVREEGKENAFSLGHTLWINTEKMEEVLVKSKKEKPTFIPYYVSACRELPGKFLLGYQPRGKPRVEFVTVTPEGFRYRGHIFPTVNGLFRWFKDHFQEPVADLTRAVNALPQNMTSQMFSVCHTSSAAHCYSPSDAQLFVHHTHPQPAADYHHAPVPQQHSPVLTRITRTWTPPFLHTIINILLPPPQDTNTKGNFPHSGGLGKDGRAVAPGERSRAQEDEAQNDPTTFSQPHDREHAHVPRWRRHTAAG